MRHLRWWKHRPCRWYRFPRPRFRRGLRPALRRCRPPASYSSPGGKAFVFVFRAKAFFFLGGLGLFSQKRIAISLGDLVVIGVDFTGRQGNRGGYRPKVDKSRLQRRFDPGYLGEVDIAFDLLSVFGRFKIEFLNPVACKNRHPGFFRVARIDKHARCH